jgi:hypothetical protein
MEDNKAGFLLAILSLAILVAAFFMLRAMDDPAPGLGALAPVTLETAADNATEAVDGLRSEMPEPQERSAAAADAAEIPIPEPPQRSGISVPEPSVEVVVPRRLPLQIPMPDGTIREVGLGDSDSDTDAP